ncbi:MAG: hypothetical protein LL057_04950 [Bifidobacterium breve]|nr:hypothetical protein [Bifidobacterium breve]
MVLSAITEASGASVLFTGDNFTRLLGGLGTSITVAGLALLVGIPWASSSAHCVSCAIRYCARC